MKLVIRSQLIHHGIWEVSSSVCALMLLDAQRGVVGGGDVNIGTGIGVSSGSLKAASSSVPCKFSLAIRT